MDILMMLILPIHEQEKDLEQIPSDHPSASTIFLKKSQMNVRGKTMKNNSYHVSPDLLRGKHSSCSTIFLDESTLSEPSVIITVQSLAIAIYYHIKYRDSNRTKDIFEEYLYPSYTEEMDSEEYYHNPDAKSIYSFIWPLFDAFHLTGQFAITTLAQQLRALLLGMMNTKYSTLAEDCSSKKFQGLTSKKTDSSNQTVQLQKTR
ncbi:cyclin-Y-like protein 1 [Molossus nigricans]